tara:strand:- start:58 stop:300 length:243 start_codon:yes stop_codon:yes gene_type:complete
VNLKFLIIQFVLLFLMACVWEDDYRQRQPQTLREEPLKTSNVASEEYINLETNQNLRQPPPQSMPNIDELSEIPAINDVR